MKLPAFSLGKQTGVLGPVCQWVLGLVLPMVELLLNGIVVNEFKLRNFCSLDEFMGNSWCKKTKIG